MHTHTEEFIGLHLKIMRAQNKSLEGIEGTITDETKNTFTIQTSRGDKKILKAGCELEIAGAKIAGDDICSRPEDRIKTRR